MEHRTKLKTEDLSLSYGDAPALVGVSVDIPSHQVTALIGPSGCGKTSFLKTINRMNDLVVGVTIEGHVYYDGADVYSECDVIELRKRIGMVFQKPNPFPMTVFDNVAYGPRVHGTHRKNELGRIVEESLHRAALWEEVKDRLHKPALGLSGGQQQRLCIARLLAVEPDVILMDEPSSALDPVSTMKIEDLIDGLKKNYTIVIVTHNLQQASRISELTAFFLNGEVVEMGRTEEIFFSPRDKRTEEYISGRFG
jgi:phosphate transport system ATP-binding protein